MSVYSHLTLVGWSSPLDYHCSFPFLKIGASPPSPAGWPRHCGSARFCSTGLHLIFSIGRLRLTQAPPVLLAVPFVFTCVLQEEQKGAACFLVTWWPGNTGVIEASRMQMLVVWKKRMWKEQAQADEGMGGITSSLPTRQPWVLLLCWIECNRPKFFSLTTGACELTSSLPWERNCHDKANAFASFFFFFYCPFLLLICVSVSSCPHFCLVCAFSLFASFILSFSLCV